MSKKSFFALIVGVCLVTLSGCATNYSMTEAMSIPNSVIETQNQSLLEGSKFSYIDNNGKAQPLTECGQPSIFEQRYCETSDGVRRFQWNTNKNGLVLSASITIDGIKHNMKCNNDAADVWSVLAVCVISD